MRSVQLGLVLFSSALLLGAGSASDPTPAVRAACRTSAMLLCPKEVATDRNAIGACLIKQFDKVSPACAAAIKAAQASKPH